MSTPTTTPQTPATPPGAAGAGTSAGQAPATPPAATGGEANPGQAPAQVYDEAYVAKLRQEAAENRTKKKELEDKLAEIERSKLSELDRTKAEKADLETKSQALASQLTSLAIKHAIALASVEMKIVDPEAAAALLDRAKLKFDEAGQPTNVKEALTELVTAKPYLVAAQGQAPEAPKVTTPGGGNPPRSTSTTLTKEQIAKMTPAEINARWSEVQQVLAT